MTSPLLTAFDRVYVINLPHRVDRRAEIAAQLRQVGMALERPPLALFPAIRPADAGPFPNVGSRGCFMSHLGVLQDAARAGCARIAILEDDLDFAPGFQTTEPAVARALESEPWDIFYGGHRIEGESAGVRESESAEDSEGAGMGGARAVVREVAPEVRIVTAHFVAFSQRVIPPLVAYLEAMLARPPGDPRGGPMHVDGAYSWFRAAHPEFRTLVSVEQLGMQRASRTDIHTLKWFDTLPLLRDLAQAARRLKRRS